MPCESGQGHHYIALRSAPYRAIFHIAFGFVRNFRPPPSLTNFGGFLGMDG